MAVVSYLSSKTGKKIVFLTFPVRVISVVRWTSRARFRQKPLTLKGSIIGYEEIALQKVVKAHGNVFNNSLTTAILTLARVPSNSCSIFVCISAFRWENTFWLRRPIWFFLLSQSLYSFGNRVLRLNAVTKDFSDAPSNFSGRHNTTSFPLTRWFY